jgi:hypothetical protein
MSSTVRPGSLTTNQPRTEGPARRAVGLAVQGAAPRNLRHTFVWLRFVVQLALSVTSGLPLAAGGEEPLRRPDVVLVAEGGACFSTLADSSCQSSRAARSFLPSRSHPPQVRRVPFPRSGHTQVAGPGRVGTGVGNDSPTRGSISGAIAFGRTAACHSETGPPSGSRCGLSKGSSCSGRPFDGVCSGADCSVHGPWAGRAVGWWTTSACRPKSVL